jgi:Family of unknown function (DUF6308)
MTAVVLRGGCEIADPLAVALGFLRGSSEHDAPDPSPFSFAEADLRRANRGGARISAAQIAAILGRRRRIERALRSIPPGASLAARSVPWAGLAELFGAFAGIHGVGLSKTTKTLHPKRPELIPMLDSVVVRYLDSVERDLAAGAFAERAVALVRSYRLDLEANLGALRDLRMELGRGGHRLSEVRILDLLIWSVQTGS